MYPRFAYHKTLAHEGRLIKSAEDEPTEEGWVDTPAKFDPNYVEPPQIGAAPGTVPEEARRRGFVPQQYPAKRYHQVTGEDRRVESAQEDGALDPSVWKDTPPASVEVPAPAQAPAAAASSGNSAPAGTTMTEEEKKAAAELNAKAAELHGTAVDKVLDALKGCDDPDFLSRITEMEALNPAGPRMSLVKAIKKQIEGLRK